MANKKEKGNIRIGNNKGQIGDVFQGDKIAGDKYIQNVESEESIAIKRIIIIGFLIMFVGVVIYFFISFTFSGIKKMNSTTNDYVFEKSGLSSLQNFHVVHFTDENNFLSLSYPSYLNDAILVKKDSTNKTVNALFSKRFGDKATINSFISITISRLPWKYLTNDQWRQVKENLISNVNDDLGNFSRKDNKSSYHLLNQQVEDFRVLMEYKTKAHLGFLEKTFIPDNIEEILDFYWARYFEFKNGAYIEAEVFLPYSTFEKMKENGDNFANLAMNFNYKKIIEELDYSFLPGKLTPKEAQVVRNWKRKGFTEEEKEEVRKILSVTENLFEDDPLVASRMVVLIVGYYQIEDYEKCSYWLDEYLKHGIKRAAMIDKIYKEINTRKLN